MLDKDKEGTSAYKTYEEVFGDTFVRNAYQYALGLKGDITPERVLDSATVKND